MTKTMNKNFTTRFTKDTHKRQGADNFEQG